MPCVMICVINVIDAFGDRGAILVVDETGDVKERHPQRWGAAPRQRYRGPGGELPGGGVSDLRRPARTRPVIDRALYLPRSWADDHDRCAAAGIPHAQQVFATKPTLAVTLIDRAVSASVPAAWVAGDEVYGADPHLRAVFRRHGLGYVMAIAANRRVPTHAGPIRVE